jgi:hypothetical protein
VLVRVGFDIVVTKIAHWGEFLALLHPCGHLYIFPTLNSARLNRSKNRTLSDPSNRMHTRLVSLITYTFALQSPTHSPPRSPMHSPPRSPTHSLRSPTHSPPRSPTHSHSDHLRIRLLDRLCIHTPITYAFTLRSSTYICGLGGTYMSAPLSYPSSHRPPIKMTESTVPERRQRVESVLSHGPRKKA